MITIPFATMSGFFTLSQNFAPILIPFKYLSSFKYAWQMVVQNELEDGPYFTCTNSGVNCNGLKTLDFLESFTTSLVCLISLIVFFKLFGFILFYRITRVKIY